MLSQLHETLVHLFRDRPAIAPQLLQLARGIALPKDAAIDLSGASFGEPKVPEYSADLVLRVRAKDAGATVIVEVQLPLKRADDVQAKRTAWPRYTVWQWANTALPAYLVVVTPSHEVERWASEPIEIGHPGFVLSPIVLGPSNMPVIERELGLAVPELAVLSAIVHGRGARAEEVATLALEAALALDPERRKLYVDAVLAVLRSRVRQKIEAMMAQKHEYMSDFARRYVAEGEAKGKAEGKAEDVLRVLEARGFAMPAAVAERVRACNDLATLDAWLVRAATLSDLDEVFR
jgi:hypothetical protein